MLLVLLVGWWYGLGMVTNFVGIQKDFTVPCGVRADVGLRVKRADGSPAAVGRATWRLGIWKDGAEAVATRFGELLPRPEGAGDGDLFWRFPALEVGLWRYELVARGSDGEVARVFYGVIGAAAASDIVEDGEVVGVKGWRMLEVLLPKVAGGKVEAHWLSGDYVLALCEVARSAAGRAEDAAGRAESAADRAEDAIAELDAAVEEATKRAEDAAERAEGARDVVLDKFEETDEFIDNFFEHAAKAIYPNSLTGTWWVGQRDSGEFYRGENGKSPIVGSDGTWMRWSWESNSWESTGTMAAGKDGFSPYINALGLWVYFDPVTGQVVNGPAASGRDGIDGDAIVRHVVGSYDDIPWSGETCTGGHVYYVPKGEEEMTRQVATVRAGEVEDLGFFVGDMGFSAMRSAARLGGVLLRFGLMAGAAKNGEPSDELLYAHVYYAEAGEWIYCGCSTNAVSQIAGEVSWWEFAELAIPHENRAMRVLLSQEAEQAAAAAAVEQVRAVVVAGADADCFCGSITSMVAQAWWQVRTVSSEGYDVYSWVVLPDESEGWVKTSAAYDLATAEVYGLMKYGTDEVVRGGAPVGRNAEGQAFVPTAEFTVAGAVKPSSDVVSGSGGGTHMTADGALIVDLATVSHYGAVKTSYNLPVDTSCIGFNAAGEISVVRAGAFQWGATRVGTSVPQSYGLPFIIPVGAAEDGVINEDGHDITGQLMNNTLYGGALRTYTAAGWFAAAPPGIDLSRLIQGSNAVGLLTSDSFFQSMAHGLELSEATESRLGGVRKMLTLGSGSDVPTGDAVMDYLGLHYYSKDSLYTREELTRDGGVIDTELQWRVPLYAEQELAKYVKKTDADSLYAKASSVTALNTSVTNIQSDVTAQGNSITAISKDVETLKKADSGYLKMVGAFAGTIELWGGSAEEFAKADMTGKRMFMTLEN